MEPIITKHLRGSKSGQTNWFELGPNEELTMGREPSNKLVFHQEEDDVVGRRHAKIVPQDDQFVIVDLNSRNGTYVNNERITEATPLKSGDVIDLGMGGPRIQFYQGKEPLNGPTTKVFQAQHHAMRATRYVSPDELLLTQFNPSAPAEINEPQTESIVMKHLKGSKSGQMNWFDIGPDEELTMGRDPSNKLIFHQEKDDLVGRRHAKITYHAGSFTIIDLDSRNGTFVNNDRIHGPTSLKSGDIIELGMGGPRVQFQQTKERANGSANGDSHAGSHSPDMRSSSLSTADLTGSPDPDAMKQKLSIGAWAVLIFIATLFGVTMLLQKSP